MALDYQAQLGERLRAIRNQQGLTLQAVEERSGGEWNAVVIGSYERGDRSVSVSKLARLAEFYGVPVAYLLPRPASAPQTPPQDGEGVVLDLTQLPEPEEEAPEAIGALARYARRIQRQRGDFNGRVLSLRAEDLDTVAVVTGLDRDELTAELRSRRLVLPTAD